MNTLPQIDYSRYYADHVDTGRLKAIAPGLAYAREMHQLFDSEEQGIPLMWPAGRQFRVRRKEVTVVSGINGHGKSAWMGQTLLDLCRHGEVCCNLSMEMPPGRTLQRQCRQAVGNQHPSFEYRARFLEWTLDRLYLSDFDRPMEPNGILGAIAWAANERQCTQVVIDSLMKCGIGEDDYNLQKWMMNSLCEFAKSLNIHIWLVAHGRKKNDELQPMDKFDVKGTGTITDLADNVLTVFRNKRKERALSRNETLIGTKPVADMVDAMVRCDKQRHGDWEGIIGLDFHRASGQFISHGHRGTMDILQSTLEAAGAIE